MRLKTPITVCMCFRHQNSFKNVFLCPMLLVWCCGDVVCSQIQLPAHVSLSPSAVPAALLAGFPCTAAATVCRCWTLHLAFSAFPAPAPSGVLTEPASSARTSQIMCTGSSEVMRNLSPYFCVGKKQS